MTKVPTQKRVWRGLRLSARSVWMLFLAVSLIANVTLGITNFMLQPIWRAAAVASATTAVKAKAEISERKAVAKAKAKEQAEARAQRTTALASAVAAAKANTVAQTKMAVASARAEEKAKGRVRRVAVAVPMVGAAIAAAFEYSDYSEWKAEHPDGVFQDYTKETLEISGQVMEEVLGEIPVELRPSKEKLLATYSWAIGAEPVDKNDSEYNVSTINTWINWLWAGQEEPMPEEP